MPLDPGIALQARPLDVPNPLTGYLQAMQAQNMGNQSALAQYTLAKAQRDQETQQVLGNALVKNRKPDGSVNWDGVTSDVANSGYADAVPAVNAAILAQREKEAQIGKTQADTGKATAETGQIQQGQKAQLAAALYASPTNENILRMYAAMPKNADGNDTMQMASALLAEPDMEKRKQILTQAAMLHPQGREALQALQPKVSYEDTGNAKVPVNTNTLAGPVGQMANTPTIAKTQTPGEAASNAIARANLGLKAIEVDPFGMSGARDIAARAGAPVGPSPAGAPQAPGQPQTATSPLASGLHGDELLKTLPPQVADMVKGYAEGRIAFPGGFAMKSPQVLQMMNLVTQYDPNFDAVNFNARSKTRNDFVAGPDAANIAAINTAMDHLVSLKSAYDTLGNNRFPLYNAAANVLGNQLGNTEVQKNTAAVSAKAEAVSHELAKVFRQTGMSEGEINAWKQKISTSASPAQSNEIINSALDLMQGRLNALGAKYNQGMGTTKDPFQLLSPHAQQALQQLRGTVGGAPTTGAGVTVSNW